MNVATDPQLGTEARTGAQVGVAPEAREVPVSRRPRQLLVLIGAVLLVAFAGVAWLQSRTLAVLKESVADRTQSLTFAYSQLEVEYLRLVALLDREALLAGSVPEETLALRHELFVSRIAQIEEGDPDLLERIGHSGDPIRGALQAYIRAADPLLAESAHRAPLQAADLAPLQQRLQGLAAPLHTLVLDAYHRDVKTAAERDAVVRSQHLTAVGLTVFQCLLTLAFAAIVAQQLRSAERRRQRLERLAADLREAQAQAEAASRAKSAFVANMSHELRTPFHGLLGMLSLMADGSLGPEQQRRLETARRSGDHLMSILNDVLDLARLESGDIGIHPSDTGVRHLFEDVLALMQLPAQKSGLALRLTLAPDVPERLQVDAQRVRQILFNLIGNAIKFTPRGEVRVEVSCLADETTDPTGTHRTLQVCVVDTGIGMDEATLARLFQRYAQGDASIQRRYGGTGLGLEISRTLARRMGGDLHATSRPGQGSTFCLTLRVEPGGTTPAGAMDSDGTAADVAGTTAQSSMLPLPPPQLPASLLPPRPVPRAGSALPVDARRALVCDDNPVNRLLMQFYLERCGYAAVLCDDGAQAVALARCNAFDLIVMDVHMPGLGGLAATQQIRALQVDGADAADPAAAIRPLILAVTADPLDDTRVAAAQAGIDELLAKPLSPADLEACLRRHRGAAVGR